MPGKDRTGPLGAGSKTGRGMGFCNGYDRPSMRSWFNMAQPGLGFRKRGGWHRWRYRYFASGFLGWGELTPEEETADLKDQADWLKNQLDAIQKRIEELASK